MKCETLELADRTITLETGRIARQANGACLVSCDKTKILVTAVAQPKPRDENLSFFPLSVEYREKSAAIGRLPSGFFKREGRISTHEILSSRLIDRSIRPLFPSAFKCETQVLANVFGFDSKAEPDTLSIIGAGVALHLSDIPWEGPIAGLRVARINKKFVPLPSRKERQEAALDIVVSCGPNGLIMVEGEAREVAESLLLDALEYARETLTPVLELLQRWRQEYGRPKRELSTPTLDPALPEAVAQAAREPLRQAITIASKLERHSRIAQIKDQVMADLLPQFPEQQAALEEQLQELEHELVRALIVQEHKRIDGRGFDEVRPISGEVSWLPSNHGSAIFTRGETQALVSCTLASLQESQIEDTLWGEQRERFMLHYNFPPYSVGEVRPMRGPGRREIGHGNLARRALKPVLPGVSKFPYTIRLVSEITESNGSSSMASVCGGSLALMDAGIPIRRPVAGIAMGLIQEGDQTVILSDILGDEDHLGDMDFKVTGTDVGITAVQLDNKIGSLSSEILEQALEQARQGRLHILGKMKAILAAPREELASHAPRIISLQIRKERIGELIGPGGSNIQEIQERFHSKIDVDENGRVHIYSKDQVAAQAALRHVRYLTAELEVDKVYRGLVVSVKEFGVFVRIFASIEGLVHISEMAPNKIRHPRDLVKEQDEIVVRVLGVDRQGKIRLSRKQALDASTVEIIDGLAPE